MIFFSTVCLFPHVFVHKFICLYMYIYGSILFTDHHFSLLFFSEHLLPKTPVFSQDRFLYMINYAFPQTREFCQRSHKLIIFHIESDRPPPQRVTKGARGPGRQQGEEVRAVRESLRICTVANGPVPPVRQQFSSPYGGRLEFSFCLYPVPCACTHPFTPNLPSPPLRWGIGWVGLGEPSHPRPDLQTEPVPSKMQRPRP